MKRKIVLSLCSIIYCIHIDNFIIHPVAAEYIEKAIHRAEAENAAALLIQLDTPGGLLESTHRIVKEIMNADVPVIVYVAPKGARAASAGVFITLSAHVAAMAPATHMGAAHPVELGEKEEKNIFKKIEEKMPKGKDEKGEKKPPPASPPAEPASPMGEKILQDTLAWVENIATARGRNVEWAKNSVAKSISSTAEELQKLGVIDLVAESEKELLEKIDGREIQLATKKVTLNTKDAQIVNIPMNWRQSILNILINPNIAYILLTLGFYGLLFEITHPGSWAPGVAGLICLLLAFYSFHMIPTDYAGVILTVLGLILLGAEIFVTSYGMLAIGGLVCLFFGALFLVDAPAEFLKLSKSVAFPTIGAAAVIFGLLLTLVVRSSRRKVTTGAEGLVGEIGEALTDLNLEGKVGVDGEIWDAVSNEPIRRGEKVQILRLENLKIYVKKLS